MTAISQPSLLVEAEQGLQGECLGTVGQEFQPGWLK